MTNLSQWFDLAEQKPWEVGVYQVEGDCWPSEDCWSYFDGNGFNYKSYTSAGHAFSMRERVGGGHRVKKWRGLSTNPEVKKKVNKRKTMYVVIDQGGVVDKPMAAFFDSKNAQEYSERLAYPRIKRIRFRTPE